MNEFPQIPTDLLNTVKVAEQALAEWLRTNFPCGMLLRWKTGKYVGRDCRVIRAIIINEPDGTQSVGLRVETRRLRNDGWMSRDDEFHRTYHDAHYFFERLLRADA